MLSKKPHQYPIHLWYLEASNCSSELERKIINTFSKTEFSRYNRINHTRKKAEYLLSRVLIRYALHQHLDLNISTIDITERLSFSPLITPLPKDTFYSLSHSKNLICFVISTSSVGVDLETINTKRGLINSASYFMSPSEIDTLNSSKNNQHSYFYRAWCAKEAFYKAQSAIKQHDLNLANISYLDLKAGNTDWHLHETEIEDNLCAIITKEPSQKIRISQVTLDEYVSFLEDASINSQL